MNDIIFTIDKIKEVKSVIKREFNNHYHDCFHFHFQLQNGCII